MKKALFLLLALTFFGGCAGVPKMPASETISDSYAYVAGKYGIGFQDIQFRRNGDKNDSANLIRLTSNEDYPIYKVQPGRYVATMITDGAGIFTGEFCEFTAEAGKVTYIGDFALNYRWSGQSAISATLQVMNNSGQARSAIKQHYPGLADRPDSIFVYRPVSHVQK